MRPKRVYKTRTEAVKRLIEIARLKTGICLGNAGKPKNELDCDGCRYWDSGLCLQVTEIKKLIDENGIIELRRKRV